ncbi:MAG: hypothetical protein AAF756_20610 [Pseudomonadota bacterium]
MDSMKVKLDMEVEIKPLSAPNYVLAAEGETSYPLSALDPKTLERLCEDFTKEVFKKAGKQRPDKAYPRLSDCR